MVDIKIDLFPRGNQMSIYSQIVCRNVLFGGGGESAEEKSKIEPGINGTPIESALTSYLCPLVSLSVDGQNFLPLPI